MKMLRRLRFTPLKGRKLRALVRQPSGTRAKELIDRGVEVVRGDLEDRSSLEPAVRGVYGVYSARISGRWARGAKCNKARTWPIPPGKRASNTSSIAPWAALTGTPASTNGKASGRLRKTSGLYGELLYRP